MDEEKTEETIENQEEEETSEEEPQKEEQETSEKNPDLTSTELEEKNKRLYARMKKAEEGEKLAKEELGKKVKPSDPNDIFDLAKTVSTLRDYNSEELDFIQMMSKAKDISPEEAAKTEEAKLYISARRQKVEADKSTPEPSTKQDVSKKSLDKITPEDVTNMSKEAKEDYFIKIGMMKKPKQFGKR